MINISKTIRLTVVTIFIVSILSVFVATMDEAVADNVTDRIIVDGASCIWSSDLADMPVDTEGSGSQTADASVRIMTDGASCLWAVDLQVAPSGVIHSRITSEYADCMFITALARPSSVPVSTPTTPAPVPVTPTEPTPEPSEEPAVTPEIPQEPEVTPEIPAVTPSTPQPSTPAAEEDAMISVYLYGHKTNVYVGEEIILDLSAINLITKPQMTVQLILKVPSGMSVTSSGFNFGGGGQYTANYIVEPGESKLIEVRIIANQAGNFNVAGDICYYFGGNISTASYKTTSLPVQVTAAQQPIQTPQHSGSTHTSSTDVEPWVIPAAVIGGLLMILLIVLAVRMKS